MQLHHTSGQLDAMQLVQASNAAHSIVPLPEEPTPPLPEEPTLPLLGPLPTLPDDVTPPLPDDPGPLPDDPGPLLLDDPGPPLPDEVTAPLPEDPGPLPLALPVAPAPLPVGPLPTESPSAPPAPPSTSSIVRAQPAITKAPRPSKASAQVLMASISPCAVPTSKRRGSKPPQGFVRPPARLRFLQVISRPTLNRVLGTTLVLMPIVGPLAAALGFAALATALDAAWSGLCHQRADRSLVLLGAQLPMCTRCMGVVLGLGLGLGLRPRGYLPARSTPVFLVGLIVVIVDARAQWSNGDAFLRALTGALVGLPAGASLAWLTTRGTPAR